MRVRESAWLLFALALASGGTHAQQPMTLQCDLLFSSWVLKPPARDMVSKDVYVNINPKTVTIEGSIAFDGTYVVSRRTKESISLDFPGRPGYLGVINRLGREIGLVELDNDGKTVKQIANGNCRSVKPPF